MAKKQQDILLFYDIENDLQIIQNNKTMVAELKTATTGQMIYKCKNPVTCYLLYLDLLENRQMERRDETNVRK
ncbi:hypothetical protein GMB34_11670 [Turicibacter sanguinis]|nr:hypothetical protein [Turicibacter sanguinis]MTN84851.1 hypothetical protein [Turicibacter sanguinis]MTN87673.1 hypothetical protein [Turicibacter sanguinis]MTN90495.1 hypothetical protein [Turicibacter sanguinis]MTN93417.1 hypothetical protein [Turicibacter sanguinis]